MMSEFHFEKMQNLDIPDEWAEKTILTATKLESTKNRNIPYNRYVVSFASVVLVVVLSVVVFMLTRDNSTVLSVDTNKESAIVQKNETKISSSIQSTVETSHPTQVQTEEITEETCNEYIEETIFEEPPEVSESQNSNPSGSSNSGSTSKPNGSSSSSSNNYKPVPPPNYVETQPATDYEEWLYSYHFHNIFMLEDLAEDRKVYCKIYSEDEGRFLGDPDLFSDEHLTEYKFINDTYCEYRYYPIHIGVLTKNGVYKSYFYNSRGEIFHTGNFFFTRFKEE